MSEAKDKGSRLILPRGTRRDENDCCVCGRRMDENIFVLRFVNSLFRPFKLLDGSVIGRKTTEISCGSFL